MLNRRAVFTLLISSVAALGQSNAAQSSAANLETPATLPIVFVTSVSANNSHPGEVVLAKTSQVAKLADGIVIPVGTKIRGHVVAANAFAYDKTPYAKQKQSALSIRFDSIEIAGNALPLKVTVRAMADPLTSWEARTPLAHDIDPLDTVTQIGGDQLAPSQSEVRNSEGDVVAYNKRGGVFAHLIANGRCDGSDVEVPVGLYSASACGLYGYTSVKAAEFGSQAAPSTLTLVSSRISPKIWKGGTALLEVLPEQQARR